MIVLKKPIVFDWDKSNQDKNYNKHQVATTEVEEVFFNKNKKLAKDLLHSKNEERYLVIGETKQHRKLYIVFTIRKNKIRVISARDLNKKEYKLLGKRYEKAA